MNDAPSFVAIDPPPVLEDSGLATVVNWASGFSPGPANEGTQTNLGYQVSAITNPGLFAASGAPTVDIGGTLRYTPAANAFGSSQFAVTPVTPSYSAWHRDASLIERGELRRWSAPAGRRSRKAPPRSNASRIAASGRRSSGAHPLATWPIHGSAG